MTTKIETKVGVGFEAEISKASVKKLSQDIDKAIELASASPTNNTRKAKKKFEKEIGKGIASGRAAIAAALDKDSDASNKSLLSEIIPSGHKSRKELGAYKNLTLGEAKRVLAVRQEVLRTLQSGISGDTKGITSGLSILEDISKSTKTGERARLVKNLNEGQRKEVALAQEFIKNRKAAITKIQSSGSTVKGDDGTNLRGIPTLNIIPDKTALSSYDSKIKEYDKLLKKTQSVTDKAREAADFKSRAATLKSTRTKLSKGTESRFAGLEDLAPSKQRQVLREKGTDKRIGQETKALTDRISKLKAVKSGEQRLAEETGKNRAVAIRQTNEVITALEAQRKALISLGTAESRRESLRKAVAKAEATRASNTSVRLANRAESQDRIQESSKVKLGRSALREVKGDVSKVQARDVEAVTAALKRQQIVLQRIAELRLKQGDSSGYRKTQESLSRVNQDLKGVGKTTKQASEGITELGKASEFAGRTIKQFLRFALGYGALYKLLGGVQALTGGLINLDESLKGIQAVSRATDKEMSKIEATIKSVAVTTKFSLDEVAKAAQVLAQAGVTPEDQATALKSVAQFAAATNSSLQTSADLISTMRNVYTDLSDGTIADQLTKAVNISKLTSEDLSTILSRGLQVSKAYNISSEQFLSAVTVLRNAGIKASTVSTGLRQSVLELLSPDDKTIGVLKTRYAQLGEDLSEGAIKSKFFQYRNEDNPLVAVLKELKRLGAAGSASKLFSRVFDVRAENVIKVLTQDLDGLGDSFARLSAPGAAAEGSRTQLESLAASMSNLGAVITSLADTLSGDLVQSLAEVTTSFTKMLDKFDEALIKSKSLKGASKGGVLASLTAGAAAATRTSGGFVKRGLVGAATAVGVGGASKAAEAGGGKQVGEAVNAISAIVAILAVFSAKASKAAGVDKLTGVVTKLSKAAPIIGAALSLHPWVRIGGIVLSLLTFVTAIVDYIPGLNKFFGVDLKERLDNSRKLLAKAKTDTDNIKEALEEYDPDVEGSYASTVADLIDGIDGIVDEVNKVLGDVLEGQTEAYRVALVKQLAGYEAKSKEYLEIGEKLGLDVDSADDLKKLAKLSKTSEDFGGDEVKADSLRSEALGSFSRLSVQNQELLSPEEVARVAAIETHLAALQSAEKSSEIVAVLKDISDGTKKNLKANLKEGDLNALKAQVSALSTQSVSSDKEAKSISAGLIVEAESGNTAETKDFLVAAQKNFDASRSAFIESSKKERSFYLTVDQFNARQKEIVDLYRRSSIVLRGAQAAVETAQRAVSEGNEDFDKTYQKLLNRLIQLQESDDPLVSAEAVKLNPLSVDTESKLDEDGRKTKTSDYTDLEKLINSLQVQADATEESKTTARKKTLKEFKASPDTQTVKDIEDLKAEISTAKKQDQFPKVLDDGGLQDQLHTKENLLLDKQLEAVEAMIKLAKSGDDIDKRRLPGLNKTAGSLRNKLTKQGSKQEVEDRQGITEATKKLIEIQLLLVKEVEGELKRRGEDNNSEELLELSQQRVTLANDSNTVDLLSKEEAQKVYQRYKHLGQQLGTRVAIQGEIADDDKRQLSASSKLAEVQEDVRKSDIGIQEAKQLTQGQQDNIARGGSLSKEEEVDVLDKTLVAKNKKKEILTEGIEDLALTDDAITKLKEDLAQLNTEIEGTVSAKEALVGTSLAEQISADVSTATASLSDWNSVISDGLVGGVESLTSSFVDMAIAGKSSFGSMRDTLRAFAADFFKQVAKIAAQKAILAGIGGAGVGGAAGTGLLGLFGSNKGSVITADGKVASSASTGGMISGPGTGTSDSIPAMVMNKGKPSGMIAVSDGEAILNAKLVKSLGVDFIHRANKGAIKGFASGGVVGATSTTSMSSITNNLSQATKQEAPVSNYRIINAWDPSVVGDYMASSAGEKVIFNHIQNSPDVVNEMIGRS